MKLFDWLKRKPAPTHLNLGCGDQPKPGFLNVDIHRYPGVDKVVDLRKKWPWKDCSIEWISASEVAEHLPDPIHFMNEAWRVLKPGGHLDMVVPSSDARGAFQDPTHKSFWNYNSFLYYSVDYPDYSRRYPQIKCQFKIKVGESLRDENGEIHTRALCLKPAHPTGSKPNSHLSLQAALNQDLLTTRTSRQTCFGEPLKQSATPAASSTEPHSPTRIAPTLTLISPVRTADTSSPT